MEAVDKVLIADEALAAIVSACAAGYPAEVCGLVGGRGAYLVEAVPVPNVTVPAPGSCGFLMDSRAQFRATRTIEGAGLDVAGIYHSHPRASAVPSDGDVRLAAYPDVAHVIVSLLDPDAPVVRAWRIIDGKVDEIELRVDPCLEAARYARGEITEDEFRHMSAVLAASQGPATH